MDPTLYIKLVSDLGFPVAFILFMGWFLANKIWPYVTDYLDAVRESQNEARTAIVKAVQNNSEMTMSLVQSMVSLKDTLEDMSTSLRDLHQEVNEQGQDLSALYTKIGVERPPRPRPAVRKDRSPPL